LAGVDTPGISLQQSFIDEVAASMGKIRSNCGVN
jgi:hypothetical protein